MPDHALWWYLQQDHIWYMLGVALILHSKLVHKQTSILTFKCLLTTFEASTNVCYSDNTNGKVASKMLSCIS